MDELTGKERIRLFLEETRFKNVELKKLLNISPAGVGQAIEAGTLFYQKNNLMKDRLFKLAEEMFKAGEEWSVHYQIFVMESIFRHFPETKKDERFKKHYEKIFPEKKISEEEVTKENKPLKGNIVFGNENSLTVLNCEGKAFQLMLTVKSKKNPVVIDTDEVSLMFIKK
ncbi:MAG TPA: hypothetical protein P5230_00935 [Candidatus Magasanikbacteria bacterium]|nr:hypothetical protein [Candidatus Magasanikbacteria bacterium]